MYTQMLPQMLPHRRLTLLAAAWLVAAGAAANDHDEQGDSLLTTDIEEVVIVSTPKEGVRLSQQPLSSTSFAQADMRQLGIDGMKALSANVPNLFIPAYGSRLTTSVYVRGVGSRTGTPAVALYVDGVPQLSPASYDFSFSDVDRIDVLRGPQSTLYGRNSMGGVVRVYTKNPFHYQGTDLTVRGALRPAASAASSTVGGATAGRRAGGATGAFSLTHYHRVSERVAFSANLFGEHDGGYFLNAGRNDEVIDDLTDLGARMRIVCRPTATLNLDITASHEWLKQGGYPYEYLGAAGNPTTPDPLHPAGIIAYDNRSGYRRNLTNAGITIDKRWQRATLTSVTGFQHLHDCMRLDQDFTDRNLYTLEQRQNTNTVSQELILRNTADADRATAGNTTGGDPRSNAYTWLTGLAAIRQWNTTEAPVTFHTDGLDWLNALINRQANTHLPTIPSYDELGREQYVMNFLFNNIIEGTDLAFPGTYATPTTNVALFHQSTIDNLFGAKGLGLTAGLRLDYEHCALDHDTHYAFEQTYGLGGRLTYPDGSVRDGMTLVPTRHYAVADDLDGHTSKGYLQLLPKVALQWTTEPLSAGSTKSVIYASMSRGYRSGGYNIQLFNELLQSRMQASIMRNVADATLPVVESVTAMPADAKARVRDILTSMAADGGADVQQTTWYKPETSWNAEVGCHLNLLDNRLRADVAAFWMETRDQQVAQMSTFGRLTVNNGRSRSIGAEVALRAQPSDALLLQAAYGYNNARFRNDDMTYVPYVPQHTLSVGATYTWQLNAAHAKDILLHADYRGAGRIYWNEANTAHQNFAGELNARLALHCPFSWAHTELALTARNILSTRYQTFYFETMQRAFAQFARPAQIGIEVRMQF